MAFGAIHYDTDHIHLHLMVSSNAIGKRERVRLTKAQFAELQKAVESFTLAKYPELAQTRIYDRDRAKERLKTQTHEQAMKARTGEPSRKERIKSRLHGLFEQASSLADLDRLMEGDGLHIYQRGKSRGVIERLPDGSERRHRLSTLGLEEHYQAIADRFTTKDKEQEMEKHPMEGNQRFFRRYLLLCGMTGTAKEIETELKSTYELNVLRIPTHKPSRRIRMADQCHLTDGDRWEAVAAAAALMSQLGRPVLVGTRSVEASEKLSAIFEAKSIAHTMLNARQDKAEAEAVAQAGEAGRITVATNMAGRGTDIKLAPGVDDHGGLHVILTEFHESARVDRQLFGRCARQGNAGSAQAIVAIEDDVFVRFAWPMNLLGKKLARSDGSVSPNILKLIVSFAQMQAEIRNRKTRVQTVKQDRKTQEMMGFAGKDS